MTGRGFIWLSTWLEGLAGPACPDCRLASRGQPYVFTHERALAHAANPVGVSVP